MGTNTYVYLSQSFQDSILIERAVAEASDRRTTNEAAWNNIDKKFFLRLEAEAVKFYVGGLPDGLAHLVAP